MKKISFLFATLLLATSLPAESLAVFSRTDSRTVTVSTRPPNNGIQAAFFRDYMRDRATAARYEAELPLVNPPAWGRTVSAKTGGSVSYRPHFKHGFVCRVQLHDLLPNHAYVLTLNGNPEKAGNALLPTLVPGNEREKYYDFLDVKTDAHGRYEGDLGLWLARGPYDVRLYVKDPVDFKIVLYRDFFRFTVD